VDTAEQVLAVKDGFNFVLNHMGAADWEDVKRIYLEGISTGGVAPRISSHLTNWGVTHELHPRENSLHRHVRPE
jgi:hypothetical protein